jgi:predicted alpha/beta hydrolase family esterase
MRIADLDILIVPGWTNSGPDHWQSRWQASMKTARRAEFGNWDHPAKSEWVQALVAAVEAAQRPVLLVAHSLGTLAVAHAAAALPEGRVAGAFLVAVPDLEHHRPPEIDPAFLPVPMLPLPFPSVLVHSNSDPYCTVTRALQFAAAWGSETADAGDAGHINTASGHGPWPEGLMRLGGFLKTL